MKIYIIDRFEDRFAVAEDADGNMINLLKEKLPEQVKEGDVVKEENGVFRIDSDETKLRAERVRNLAKDLFS